MKKLLFTFAVLALLSALPGPLTASTNPAVGPQTQVCHVTGQANDELFGVTFGRVITVSDKAVDAHEDHGDSTGFWSMDEVERAWLEDFYGVALPNANCYMFS